jgi:DNA-binding NarL/FixJ family response regulator
VTRIAIVDDHQLVREGLASLLRSVEDFDVVGLAAGGVDGVRLVLEAAPDVVLLDLSMPDLDGLGVLMKLRAAQSSSRCLLLTTFDDDMAMLKATALGAAGFLLKDLSRDELVAAIRAVQAGGKVFRPTVTTTLRTVLRSRKPDVDRSHEIAPLTAREIDVLRLMAGGLGNKEIAFALGLSEGTVKNHVSVILDKFCAPDRTRAVLKAIERGLV